VFSNDLSNRMRIALGSGLARDELRGLIGGGNPFGRHFFVDTVHGSDSNDGRSTVAAKLTMAGALAAVDSRDTIWAVGDIREQDLYAPLGVYGVRIVGSNYGRPHHSTAGNAPLLKLREQGWEIHNITMIPESGYAAVQLRCAEDATDPDASHPIFYRVRFISGGTRVGYGLEQIGGSAQLGVYGCWFTNLEYAYKPTSYGIRNDQDHEWFDNRFAGCKHDIAMNATRCEFRRNRHFTKYDGTTHPTTLNLANTGGDGNNWVQDVEFADNLADVTIAKGYKPGTGDVWRTREADTAADDVVVPA
jgi:hypothetical protein